MACITRFAPSPTGPLHLGHAFSALTAFDMARANGGRFLLRIEDIDRQRSRPEWEAQIYDDLGWLGLTWSDPVMRQSERAECYGAALDTLWARGLIYPCSCTRHDIEAASSAPQEGVAAVGPVYPGTCRGRERPSQRPGGTALRLDMAAALTFTRDLWFEETEAGRVNTSAEQYIHAIGDVVVGRRDMDTSYHLSVVMDDDAQGVTLVTRGADLFDSTRIHVVLQRLLGLATPVYHHHRLIRDDSGKRLAKRDDSRGIRAYRQAGTSPAHIRAMVGLQATGSATTVSSPSFTSV